MSDQMHQNNSHSSDEREVLEKKDQGVQKEKKREPEIVQTQEKKKFFSKKCKNCEKKEQEALEYKAGWQRAQADYQNLVREMDVKKHEWLDWSKQQILEEFIPIFDNFKKSMQFAPSDQQSSENKQVENWLKGIQFIMKQFGDVLKGHGVEEIKTIGEQFNPEFHEAVAEEESEEQEDIILREVGAGYRMNGKVIKVAKVIVAKKQD